MSEQIKDTDRPFRFFDNREKYLLFVTTCSEKWAIGQRVGAELQHLNPLPPALRIFDAGTGDGTVLASVLRQMHGHYPTIPFLVVGKEISLEDVRLTLEKLPDRFSEHPQTVVVMTNMHYREAPWLRPSDTKRVINWQEVALHGSSAHEFESQIHDLRQHLADWWEVATSPNTGNPVYVEPTALVLYRKDQRFSLHNVIPRPNEPVLHYDLAIAAQPYRARNSIDTKVRYVLKPLANALAPGGRMIVVQSTGQDPGMEIIRRVWPDEDPFRSPAPLLLEALRRNLEDEWPQRDYTSVVDTHSFFRFGLHIMPDEISEHIGTSTLLAAWNAAVYVAQIDDARVNDAMIQNKYMEATQEVLARHGGLWFVDESFVLTRRS